MSGLLADGRGRRALEAGPTSPRVYGAFLRERGWRYESIDQSRSGHPNDPRAVHFVDRELDLCDLAPLADGSLDLVIVQHVIEEIADYQKALAEIARVLAHGGTALLEIPFKPSLERSERHPANSFGNVWSFGADLPAKVGEHFDGVRLVEMREGAYFGRLHVCEQQARRG